MASSKQLRESSLTRQLCVNLRNVPESKEQAFLTKLFKGKKVRLDIGGGAQDELTVDEANKKWLSNNFPNLDKTTYWWPPVFHFKHPGEPTDLIFASNQLSEVPRENINYSTLQTERKGEIAEEHTIMTIIRMFSTQNIPGYIIHGYQWVAQYLRSLKKYPNFSNIVKRVLPRDSETDVLISLPGKFILTVEVKAINPDDSTFTRSAVNTPANDISNETSAQVIKNLTETTTSDTTTGLPVQCGICGEKNDEKVKNELLTVVLKALTQCDKTTNILRKTTRFDNCLLIKAVALPNCRKEIVNELFCSDCRVNIVSQEDLESDDRLFSWFKCISDRYAKDINDAPYDLTTHEHLIASLVGPASMVKVRTLLESVEVTVQQTNEFGSADRLQGRWCQLTSEQRSIMDEDSRFLFMTGAPGSGKSLLCSLKAKQILNSDGYYCSGHDVLFIHAHNGTSLTQWYKKELETYTANLKTSVSCEVIVEDKTNLEISSAYCATVESPLLLRFEYLRRQNPGKRVHMIIDEYGGPVMDSSFSWVSHVPPESLGYFWIIRDSAKTKPFETPPSVFSTVHLAAVMRMSRQNVGFVNHMLQRNYVPGHAVSGIQPVVYRMKCICYQTGIKSDFCHLCHPVRIACLLQTAVSELKLSSNIHLTESVVLSTVLAASKHLLNQLGERQLAENIDILPLLEFKGCERSFVFLDVDEMNEFLTDGRMEGLTRCLGRLVILDGGGGCRYYDHKKHYEKLSEKMDAAFTNGYATVRNIDVSGNHLEALQHILKMHLTSNSNRSAEDTSQEPDINVVMDDLINSGEIQQAIAPLYESDVFKFSTAFFGSRNMTTQGATNVKVDPVNDLTELERLRDSGERFLAELPRITQEVFENLLKLQLEHLPMTSYSDQDVDTAALMAKLHKEFLDPRMMSVVSNLRDRGALFDDPSTPVNTDDLLAKLLQWSKLNSESTVSESNSNSRGLESNSESRGCLSECRGSQSKSGSRGSNSESMDSESYSKTGSGSKFESSARDSDSESETENP